MGHNNDRSVGQRGYISDIFYPHRAVVGGLERLHLWERTPSGPSAGDISCRRPRYLANDFWLNSASQFGTRFYYTQGIAFAANFIPISVILYILFVFTCCATSIVVAFAARDLSGSTGATLVITSLSVSISPFWLGHHAGFLTAMRLPLIPSALAEPFLVFAIWRGIRGEPVCAATACIPTILMHPVLGVNAAGIALTAALSRCLWLAWPHCLRIKECGLRFGRSYPERCHGSVLDRASPSLGRDFFSFNGTRRIRAYPCPR